MSERINQSTTKVLPAGKAPRPDSGQIESALIMGDLSKLTEDQRISYYLKVCETVGLNPTTRPFDYHTLNGKLVLYASKSCAEQLRSIHKVSVTIKSRETVGDCYVVTASALLPDGRVDESLGAVSVGGLKGDALCNALMKAETKAKRRVTLSICGLGMLDECELETTGNSFGKAPRPAPVAPKQVAAPAVVVNAPKAPQAPAEAAEEDIPNFPSEEPGPFDLRLTSGLHAGKQIKELTRDEAGAYFDEISSTLKLMNRPASTLRGVHRDIYYALQSYVFGDQS